MRSQPVRKSPTDSPSEPPRLERRDFSLDYLRSFLIVLVVFLHAALAYTKFSTFDFAYYIHSTAPIVDSSRWPVLDLIVLFIDTFFMALLFLISGFFAVSSLRRKGSRDFFLGRLRRLGIPFVVSVLVLMPLAFWPSFLMSTPESHTGYWIPYFTTDGWSTGPAWFLWLLLAFDGVLALAYRFAPSLFDGIRRTPSALVIFLATVASFLPAYIFLSPYWWVSLAGPFDVQPARIPLYLAYFLLGIALGANPERRNAVPKYRGWYWPMGILSFLLFFMLSGGEQYGLASKIILGIAFASSCAGASLGLLGVFLKHMRRRHPILDSLGANAFGIYILHYGIVTWIQYALLSGTWPAWIKFSVVFVGGLTLSWGAAILIRRIIRADLPHRLTVWNKG